MKIRSDFVTNSSSYSSVCIRIQSKKLADLLTKYKVEGGVDGLSIQDSQVSIVNSGDACHWERVPEQLDELITCLSIALEDIHFWDPRFDAAMFQELNERKQELTDSVQEAAWDFDLESNEGRVRASRNHFRCERQADGSVVYERSDTDRPQDTSTPAAEVSYNAVETVPIQGSAFVLTGNFAHCGGGRDGVKALIVEKGGRCTGSISGKTDYLVVGSLGNFGAKKLEQAAEQQAKGKALKIIREYDLFRSLED